MNSQTAYLLLKHTLKEIGLNWREFLGMKAQYAKALKNVKLEEKTVYQVSDKIIKSIEAIGSQIQHHEKQTTTPKPKSTSTKPQQITTSINLTPTLHQIQTIFSLPSPSIITSTCPATLSQLLFISKTHLNLISFIIKQQMIDLKQTINKGLVNFIEGNKKFVQEFNYLSWKVCEKKERDVVNRMKEEWKTIMLRITGKYFEYAFNLIQQNDSSHDSMQIMAHYLLLIAEMTTATIIVPTQNDPPASTSFWPFKRSIKQNSVTNTTVVSSKLQKSSISISGQHSQCQSMQETSQNGNNENHSKLTSNIKNTQPQSQPLLANNQLQIIQYYKKSLMETIFSQSQTLLPTLFSQLTHAHLTSQPNKNTLQLTILQLLYSHMSRQQLQPQVSEELQFQQYNGLLQRCNLFFSVLEKELNGGENQWRDGNKERMLEFVVEIYEKVMIEHKAFLERQFQRKLEMSTKMGAEMRQKHRKSTGSNFRRFSFAQSMQDNNKPIQNNSQTTENTNETCHTTDNPIHLTLFSNPPLNPTPQPFSLQLYQTNFSVINILNLLYEPLNKSTSDSGQTTTLESSLHVNKLNILLTLHQVYLNQLNLPQLTEWINKRNKASRDSYLYNMKDLKQKLTTAHHQTYISLTPPQSSTNPNPTLTASQQQQQQYLLSYQTIILQSLQQLASQLNELLFVYYKANFTQLESVEHFQYYKVTTTRILTYVRELMQLMYNYNAPKKQNNVNVIKNNVMTSIRLIKLLQSVLRAVWLEYSKIYSQDQQDQSHSPQYKKMIFQVLSSWMSTLSQFCGVQCQSQQLQYRNLKSLQIMSVILGSFSSNSTLQNNQQSQQPRSYLSPDTRPFIKQCLTLCQHAYPYLSIQPHLKTKSRIFSSVIHPLFQLFSYSYKSHDKLSLTLLVQVMDDNFYLMKEKLAEDGCGLGAELMVFEIVQKYFEGWLGEGKVNRQGAIGVEGEQLLERLVIVLQLYHNQYARLNGNDSHNYHNSLLLNAKQTLTKIDQLCNRVFRDLIRCLLLFNQTVEHNQQQQCDTTEEQHNNTTQQQGNSLLGIITQSPLFTISCLTPVTCTLSHPNPNIATLLTLFTKLCQLASTTFSLSTSQQQHNIEHQPINEQQLAIELASTFSRVLLLTKDQGMGLNIEQLERLLQLKEMVVKGVRRRWGNFIVTYELEMMLISVYVRGKSVGRVEELLGMVEGQVNELVGFYSSSSDNAQDHSDSSGNNNNSSSDNNKLHYLTCLTHPLPHLTNIIQLLLHNQNYQQPLQRIITTLSSLYLTISSQTFTPPPPPSHTPTLSNLTVPETPSFKLHSQQPSGLQSITNNNNRKSGFAGEVKDQSQCEDEWGMSSDDNNDGEQQEGKEVIVSELEIGESRNTVGCSQYGQLQQQYQQHQQHQYHQQNQYQQQHQQHHEQLQYPYTPTPTTRHPSYSLHLTHFHTQLLTILPSSNSNCQPLLVNILSTLVKICQAIIKSKNYNIERQEERKQLMVEVVRAGIRLSGGDTSSSDVLVLMGQVEQSISQLHLLYPFLQQQLPTLKLSQPHPTTHKQPTSQEPQPPHPQPNLFNLPNHLQQLLSSSTPSQLLTLLHNTKHSLSQQLSTLYQSLLHQPQPQITPTQLLLQQIHQLFLKLLNPTPTTNPPQPQTIQCYHQLFSTLYPTLVDLLEFPQLSKAIKLILKQNLQLKSTPNNSNTMTHSKLQQQTQ